MSIVMPIADVMISVVENPARVANEHRPSKRRVILNKKFESLEGLLDDDNKIESLRTELFQSCAEIQKALSSKRKRRLKVDALMPLRI